MIEEVLAHSTLELGRRMAAPLFGLRDLLFPVARVPLVCIGALTQEADPLSRLVPQRPIWKLSEGLGLVTHATRPYSERRLERSLDRRRRTALSLDLGGGVGPAGPRSLAR